MMTLLSIQFFSFFLKVLLHALFMIKYDMTTSLLIRCSFSSKNTFTSFRTVKYNIQLHNYLFSVSFLLKNFFLSLFQIEQNWSYVGHIFTENGELCSEF